MKTMVCTGCEGNWSCTVELGVDSLEPDRCVCDPKNDQWAEWLDTTGETKVRLEIAKAAIEYVRVVDRGASLFLEMCEREKLEESDDSVYQQFVAIKDLCKKLEATP